MNEPQNKIFKSKIDCIWSDFDKIFILWTEAFMDQLKETWANLRPQRADAVD